MADIHYQCTQCGKCCTDTRIPLTVSEALEWLGRGHPVQLLCEASPWPSTVSKTDAAAAYFEGRSFAAQSGSIPLRIVVMLVAHIAGPCPNLLADKRCGIYDERPLVCRIYPAELNPFVALRPDNKVCPPEAWDPNLPLLQRGPKIMNSIVAEQIGQWRATDARDAGVRRRLCRALNVSHAALVHEAVLVYSPPPPQLLAALNSAIDDRADAVEGAAQSAPWRLVSDRAERVHELVQQGALSTAWSGATIDHCQYLPFQRQALFGPFAV